jgi:hypothetical protein
MPEDNFLSVIGGKKPLILPEGTGVNAFSGKDMEPRKRY